MKVERFVWGFLETHTYLLQEGNYVLEIDPTDDDEVLAKCSDAASVTVLLTHEHFDHISGLNKLRDYCKSPCTVIASEKCSEQIQDAKSNMSLYADVLAEVAEKPLLQHLSPFTCHAADITFKDKYVFNWKGHTIEMFVSPGHSAGSCCILVDDVLFAGDTVLENKLMAQFPCSSKKLYRCITVPLLERLLKKVIYVYPGHGEVMQTETALILARNV